MGSQHSLKRKISQTYANMRAGDAASPYDRIKKGVSALKDTLSKNTSKHSSPGNSRSMTKEV